MSFPAQNNRIINTFYCHNISQQYGINKPHLLTYHFILRLRMLRKNNDKSEKIKKHCSVTHVIKNNIEFKDGYISFCAEIGITAAFKQK